MTKRTLLLSIALLSLAVSAWINQSAVAPSHVNPDTAWTWMDAQTNRVVYANHPVATDSVSKQEAFRHIERLYRHQARLMSMQARGDTVKSRRVLDTAIRDLATLIRRPGLAHQPRFQSVFQAITSEYREVYGVPDTLDLPRGSIYDLRKGVFTAVNQSDDPRLENALPSDLREMDTDVPMTVNPRVREAMAFLLKNRNLHLYPWLRRAETYFPMIEHIFAEENVPDELKYLALVESGLNPYAHSHASAGGLWQFVAETGRRYGLTIDPWVDERRDPEKATRAAARHLRDLHDMFGGDWHLALAGYNVSPARVKRELAKARRRMHREPTYWDIYDDLPEETRNYVPLFIATSIIISNPAAFDLKRVTPGPRYAFDHVPVDATMELEQVAQLAEADVQTVRALNPELRADRVPPSDEPYYIRLPYGSYPTFKSNFDALSEAERTSHLKHAVQTGETAGHIAKRYHVSRPSLLQANNVHPAEIEVGRMLTVPAAKYLGNSEIVSSADARPIRVRYGSRATRPIAVPALPTADAKDSKHKAASGQLASTR
ncbi:lytic transglycosylase [Longibacter salinarum]|uniref:Lytic transglycosylase n=1 Tax=Longibacter salinarum TaxID=1850348 RepID=A0A2A8CUD5_9BACT|nr:lytic transglycosylase domain-containing protein [Longibacter salinarum]PEN11366.1 lytic transglycosylase [Longibacter salinarum]